MNNTQKPVNTIRATDIQEGMEISIHALRFIVCDVAHVQEERAHNMTNIVQCWDANGQGYKIRSSTYVNQYS